MMMTTISDRLVIVPPHHVPLINSRRRQTEEYEANHVFRQDRFQVEQSIESNCSTIYVIRF